MNRHFFNKNVVKMLVFLAFPLLVSSFGCINSKLNQQLKETNILIGNSVSDYEEQKVFFTNFKKHPSSWHFVFAKKSTDSNKWMNDYKMCYFAGMGIIPVFFDDYSDMTNHLKTL